MKLQTKNALKGFSLILPLLLGCLVFYGLPFLLVVWYSLFQGGRFTALDTYIRLLENEVYDGIAELLSSLRKDGKRLLVATSKPEVFSVRILEHFGLDKYFEVISGAMLHPPKGYGKADVIREALKWANISDLDGVIMVGDRKHDIIGAHTVGIPAIGVLYGYGDREEHASCGADYIVESVSELKELLR